MTERITQKTRMAQVEQREPGYSEILLNLGPSHPTTHGIVRLLLKVEGEEIIDCDVEIGYLHRGFEKMCENHPWNMGVVYVDRLNYVSPVINNVGYHMAVEKLLDLEVPAGSGGAVGAHADERDHANLRPPDLCCSRPYGNGRHDLLPISDQGA